MRPSHNMLPSMSKYVRTVQSILKRVIIFPSLPWSSEMAWEGKGCLEIWRWRRRRWYDEKEIAAFHDWLLSTQILQCQRHTYDFQHATSDVSFLLVAILSNIISPKILLLLADLTMNSTKTRRHVSPEASLLRFYEILCNFVACKSSEVRSSHFSQRQRPGKVA